MKIIDPQLQADVVALRAGLNKIKGIAAIIIENKTNEDSPLFNHIIDIFQIADDTLWKTNE